MRLLNRLSIRHKQYAIVILAMLAIAALVESSANRLYHRMLDDRIVTMRTTVNLAVSYAQSLQDQVQAGTLTRDEAIARFRVTGRAMHYDGAGGYIFSIDDAGKIFSHPRLDLEGTQGPPDASGQPVGQLLRDAVRGRDDAIVTYTFPKQEGGKPLPKLTYVQWFAPWQILLGTGMWIDDLDAELWRAQLHLGLFGLGMLALIAVAATLVARDLVTPLTDLRKRMQRLAGGDLSTGLPDDGRTDEVGGMIRAVRVFRENGLAMRRIEAEKTALARQHADAMLHRTRELEAALSGMRLSESRLRDFISTASDWYWETDASWRFTDISVQSGHHFIRTDELIGLDRLTDDSADAHVAHRREILERREPFSDMRFEYPREWDLRTLSLSGVPVRDEDGTFLGYRGSARDITDQLRAEAVQRSARYAAEQANRAKSTFLATMSHEIRTPMNGVLGLLQLLRDTSLDDEQRQMCDAIYQSGAALQQILNDILDYSKLEAGRITLELLGLRLPEVVVAVVALMRGTADAKGVAIEFRTEGPEPPPVLADPTRLRQILFNLLSNAIKFSEQGAITVTLATTAPEDGQVHCTLAVTDRGIGMSQETQRQLFVRFVQADTSTTRRFGGTGLGLSITRELVTLMDGTIEVASELGQGSTFTVHLPLRVTDSVTALLPGRETAAAISLAPLLCLRILVAEDDGINQRVIVGMLRGHRCTVVGNGAEALRLVGEEPFDLVLMDAMMPIMDGVAATQAIRGLPEPAGSVPIIALTANSMTGDKERYIAAGMNGYVSKPISRPDLFHEIERVLGLVVWASVDVPDELPSELAPPEEVSPETVRSIDEFLDSLDLTLGGDAPLPQGVAADAAYDEPRPTASL